jgi:putative membrane protein
MKSMWIRTAVLAAASVCCSGTTFAAAPGAQSDSGSSSQDKAFVEKASEGSLAEISFSKIALRKSKNDEVKTFAKKMIEDHTTLMTNMKPIADQMGLKPPTKLNKEHQMEADRLESLSGDKFDKEYITAMVGDHHKDLGEFMTQQNATSNAQLKSTVEQGTQVIRQHTEMIDQIAQKNGITTPPMPSM